MSVDCQWVEIDAPADKVFGFLADPGHLTLWSFGTWRIEEHADGLIQGRALATGDAIWLRIDAAPDRLLIDFHLGATPETMAPRIFARVIPGHVNGASGCLLMFTAMREAGMNEQRWARLKRAHGAELDILKAAIETGFDHREM